MVNQISKTEIKIKTMPKICHFHRNIFSLFLYVKPGL